MDSKFVRFFISFIFFMSLIIGGILLCQGILLLDDNSIVNNQLIGIVTIFIGFIMLFSGLGVRYGKGTPLKNVFIISIASIIWALVLYYENYAEYTSLIFFGSVMILVISYMNMKIINYQKKQSDIDFD